MFEEEKYARLLAGDKIEEAKRYIIDTIPDYIIKFFSLTDKNNVVKKDIELDEKKLTTLETNCNWFCKSIYQNDPFDMRMFYVDEKNYTVDKKYIDKSKEIVEQLRDAFLLCSFTGNSVDDLSMWANYSNNHKGFCVKYKVNRKELINRIFYYDKINDTTVLQLHLLDSFQGMLNGEQNSDEVEKFRYINMMLLNIKHCSWNHENEFRVLYPADLNGNGQNINNNVVGLKPEAIYVGLNCIKEYERRLKIISQKLDCNCLKVKTDSRKFVSFENI